MHLSNWQDTRIWEELSQLHSQEAVEVQTFLNSCMPGIQAVLAQGGTAPLNFTLHDSEHSFRVAKRMVDLIPHDSFNGLSVYELALLLLSAYLHDIGMTPERKKVSSHHHYLMTGKKGELTDQDIDKFQEWLDDYQNGIVPPLSRAEATPEDLELGELIITHYCRERHNDWSGEWIEKNLSKNTMGAYSEWQSDLVVLCQSHHYGYQKLKEHRFNPRLVGANGEVVHLRYLAAVLRVADVLEFDPERTPAVIFEHRDVHPTSKIFWWKDASINSVLEDNRLIISARPANAYIHKAIEDTIDQVDEELHTCRMLADETDFQKCPHLHRELPHKWNLPFAAHRIIEPLNAAYVYINGAFRPDTKKLLELLSGSQLYGAPVVAVRELLQNAFDAVREQIAYVRLGLPDPSAVRHEDILGMQNKVLLKIDKDEANNVWLICEDTGVGMTQRIINDYLLVSGRGIRHDVLDLERRCEKAGYRLGRTGQFGIGVLSYFMLASKAIINTRRSQDSGQVEPTGWRFETEGVGSFGELRKEVDLKKGTTVRLKIRPDVIGSDIQVWIKELFEYVRHTLVRIPCRFEFSAKSFGIEPVQLGPGWTRQTEEMTDLVVRKFRPTRSFSRDDKLPTELLSAEQRAEQDAVTKHFDEVRSEVRSTIRWKTTEGELPNRVGIYRIHYCYFDLPRGESLAFLRSSDEGGVLRLKKIGKGYSFIPPGASITSWKGISVGIDPQVHLSSGRDSSLRIRGLSNNTILEVDILSNNAGNIRVDRNAAQLQSLGQVALKASVQAASNSLKDIVVEHRNSVYQCLSSVIVGEPLLTDSRPYWIKSSKETGAVWAPLIFPAISSLAFTYGQIPAGMFLWKQRPIQIVQCLGQVDDENHYDGITWHGRNSRPSHIVVLPVQRGFRVTALWKNLRNADAGQHVLGLTAKYPPRWRNLIGVKFARFHEKSNARIIWNDSNPIVSAINPDSWAWCQNEMKKNPDPLVQKDRILSDRSNAASWIAYSLVEEQKEIWDGLRDRDPDFLSLVLLLAIGKKFSKHASKKEKAYFWVEEGASSRMRVLHTEGWQVVNKHEESKTILPDPGKEWCLEYQPPSSDVDIGEFLDFQMQKQLSSISSPNKAKTSTRSKPTSKRGRKSRKVKGTE